MSASVLTLAMAIMTAKNNDPILMTVNSIPVHKSEFEYLYKKNNSQQLKPQTLDEYVDMFVNYKLKVADALKSGLDTTAEFKAEFAKFKGELADPYLMETEVMDSLIQAAYNQQLKYLHVKHLMLPEASSKTERQLIRDNLDSIRTEIVAGRLSWDDAVAKYSIDRSSNTNGGDMGWMMPSRYPYSFVDMAYATPIGEISPVVSSGFGFHIIKVVDQMPNPGEVEVEHILKLTANKSPEDAAKAKVQIDSIYNLVKNGADFKDVARRESEDPGSASRGGALGWFGKGTMVAPFDSAAFALADGEISAPVRTSYGYHILHKLGHRDVASLDKMKPQLENAINGDDRSLLPRIAKIKRLKKQFNGRIDDKGLDKVKQLIEKNGGYDSTTIALLAQSDITVYSIGKKKYPVSEVINRVSATAVKDAANARNLIATAANSALEADLIDLEREDLINSNAEYRNLVNEYRDGILLFNIASEKVWDRASKDTKGLEEYFRQHRDKYKWQAPKFKGYVIFAENDSVLNVIKDFVNAYDTKDFDNTKFTDAVRAKFGREAKVERVIAAKGDNAITDYLAFDGPKPESNNKWKVYFAFRGHIINAPEEAADVRGLVTADYQTELEDQWIKDLRKKYPVNINKKVLDTISQ